MVGPAVRRRRGVAGCLAAWGGQAAWTWRVYSDIVYFTLALAARILSMQGESQHGA